VSETQGQFRAVLIGIEAYWTRALTGCVNDIDAVQQLLIERAGVPAANIQRLASAAPTRSATRPASIPEAPATLANIRAALEALSAQVEEGDDVLVYYSGHGLRAPVLVDGYTFHREALVPIDVDHDSALDPADRLLFDDELNGYLTRIAAIARSVTCILDCCHAAGVYRDPTPISLVARSLDPKRDLRWRTPLRAPAAAPAPAPTRVRAPDAPPILLPRYHVVSACLDFETAMECPGRAGKHHGLLTHAWLCALDQVPDAELWTVRWSQIWQAMRVHVESVYAHQHIWMAGAPGRRVLGGPPATGDAGLPLRRGVDARTYEIDAGALESVTEDAVIAVYGVEPDQFPALDSDEDHAARLGVLRVTQARADRARAVALGEPFELPPGARGRLVAAGHGARLPCALEPREGAIDAAIDAAIRESPLLELTDPARARVRLRQVRAGWLLADAAHEASRATALAVLPHLRPDQIREVLEHYYLYSVPLRLAEVARDLPDALELRVLACAQQLSPSQALTTVLPEAPRRDLREYEIPEGAQVCFRVHNRSGQQLRVALLNVAASGRVQLLGEAPLDGRSAQMYWALGELGRPFKMSLPPDRLVGLDRLIAVGTTDLYRDLGYLKVDRRFADIVETTRSGPDELVRRDLLYRPSGSRWTTARVTVRTYQKRGGGHAPAARDDDE
jgi:hypothetical protein